MLKPTYKLLPDYLPLIGRATGENHFRTHGLVPETVAEIKATAERCMPQVKKLADHLYAPEVEQAAFNVWHWLFHNLRYKLDARGVEEIRSPRRSYQDGRKDRPESEAPGIDCEDFSIFAFCLLTQMGYEPEFHVVAFNGSEYYGHIFVQVSGYTIDPCPPLTEFNQKAPNITKTMRIMSLNGISGLGAVAIADTIQRQRSELEARMIREPKSRPQLQKELRKLEYAHNLATMARPEELQAGLRVLHMIEDISPAGNFVLKPDVDLDTAAKYATLHLLKAEGSINGLMGLGATFSELDQIDNMLEEALYGVHGIGFLKKVVKKVGNAVSNTFDKVKDTVTHVADKVADGVKEAIDDPLGTFMKLNPVTLLARNALLLAMKINLFGMAENLKWGYLTDEQAAALNMDIASFKKVRETVKKVENLFDGIGGERENLKKAILDGGGSLSGIGATGTEPAAGLIATITGWLKSIPWGTLLKNVGKDAANKMLNDAKDKLVNNVTNQFSPGSNNNAVNNNGFVLDYPATSDLNQARAIVEKLFRERYQHQTTPERLEMEAKAWTERGHNAFNQFVNWFDKPEYRPAANITAPAATGAYPATSDLNQARGIVEKLFRERYQHRPTPERLEMEAKAWTERGNSAYNQFVNWFDKPEYRPAANITQTPASPYPATSDLNQARNIVTTLFRERYNYTPTSEHLNMEAKAWTERGAEAYNIFVNWFDQNPPKAAAAAATPAAPVANEGPFNIQPYNPEGRKPAPSEEGGNNMLLYLGGAALLGYALMKGGRS